MVSVWFKGVNVSNAMTYTKELKMVIKNSSFLGMLIGQTCTIVDFAIYGVNRSTVFGIVRNPLLCAVGINAITIPIISVFYLTK